MTEEELMEELEKLPIEEVIGKFTQVKLEDENMFRAIIKTMTKRDFLFIDSLIVMMVKEQLQIGYKKFYSLSELVERLPWQKSQTCVKLKKAVKEVVASIVSMPLTVEGKNPKEVLKDIDNGKYDTKLND